MVVRKDVKFPLGVKVAVGSVLLELVFGLCKAFNGVLIPSECLLSQSVELVVVQDSNFSNGILVSLCCSCFKFSLESFQTVNRPCVSIRSLSSQLVEFNVINLLQLSDSVLVTSLCLFGKLRLL